ncbi:hypothetical protein NFI96_003955 [Prochilodus magdalenae]|nr:hypothetical protein NFI96_003955 [Prochilodus magdalenae]
MQDPAGQAMDVDHGDGEEGLVVRHALAAQGELMGWHEQLLQQIMQQLTQLTQASNTSLAATATTHGFLASMELSISGLDYINDHLEKDK